MATQPSAFDLLTQNLNDIVQSVNNAAQTAIDAVTGVGNVVTELGLISAQIELISDTIDLAVPNIGLLNRANTWTVQNTFETTGTQQVVLQRDDSGATAGPGLISLRNSASPAAADDIGFWENRGKNSTPSDFNYLGIVGAIDDPTAGSEDASWKFNTAVAGSYQTRWKMSAGFYYNGGTDPGANKINVTGINIAGTDIFARANTWTNINTFNRPGSENSLTLQLDDDNAGSGPRVYTVRNSASPAVNDYVGGILMRGKDSLGNNTDYGSVEARIVDPTDGSEDSKLVFRSNVAGSFTDRFYIGDGFYYSGGADPGANNINCAALWIGGTDIFARANTWINTNTFSTPSANPAPIGLIYSDDGAAGGPQLNTLRISASPAANDYIGQYYFNGRDTGGAQQTYAEIETRILDPTAGSEDAQFTIYTVVAGVEDRRFHFSAGMYYNGGSDPGAGKINVTGINLSGTDLFARANTWTALNIFDGGTSVQVPVYFQYNDATSGAGPITDWYRLSASPAAADNLTYLRFYGQNSSAAQITYAQMYVLIDDATAASEDSHFTFKTYVAGTLADSFKIGAGLYYASGADPGANKINATGYNCTGTAVVGTRKTGWAAATGTATRTTFATGTVTLPVLAEHVKALIDDLISHGLIGT